MERADWPANANFVRTELETGITFAGIALGAKTRDKIQRNRANARLAYDTALKHVGKVPLTPEMSEKLSMLRDQLRGQLAQLGEYV